MGKLDEAYEGAGAVLPFGFLERGAATYFWKRAEMRYLSVKARSRQRAETSNRIALRTHKVHVLREGWLHAVLVRSNVVRFWHFRILWDPGSQHLHRKSENTPTKVLTDQTWPAYHLFLARLELFKVQELPLAAKIEKHAILVKPQVERMCQCVLRAARETRCDDL